MKQDVKPRIELQCDRIGAEVERAMALHSPMNSAHEAYAVILEELEEFWDEVKVNPKKLSVDDVIRRRRHMQDELLQIAAMCIRATIDCDLMNYYKADSIFWCGSILKWRGDRMPKGYNAEAVGGTDQTTHNFKTLAEAESFLQSRGCPAPPEAKKNDAKR